MARKPMKFGAGVRPSLGPRDATRSLALKNVRAIRDARARSARPLTLAATALATVCVGLAWPAASGASVVTWGPDLSLTPTLDTANGDHTAGPSVGSPSPAT